MIEHFSSNYYLFDLVNLVTLAKPLEITHSSWPFKDRNLNKSQSNELKTMIQEAILNVVSIA